MAQSLFQRFWNTSPASLTKALQRRLRRDQPRWTRVESGPLKGGELNLPKYGLGWVEMRQGIFDSFMYEALLRDRTLQGLACWDVGAHFGYHSLSFAALGARVYAFEPNPSNQASFREHLAKNANLSERIHLLPIALSDEDGEAGFTQSDDLRGASTGSHLNRATPPLGEIHYEAFHQARVKTARADTLVSDGVAPPPDVMKVDVEGAEALVLRGAETLLKSQRPLILMEVHHIRLMLEVSQLLDSFGYRIELLGNPEASPSRCFIMAKASSESM